MVNKKIQSLGLQVICLEFQVFIWHRVCITWTRVISTCISSHNCKTLLTYQVLVNQGITSRFLIGMQHHQVISISILIRQHHNKLSSNSLIHQEDCHHPSIYLYQVKDSSSSETLQGFSWTLMGKVMSTLISMGWIRIKFISRILIIM